MRRFTAEHEWVDLIDGVATVGITAHAQEALGDLVFIELPEPGREVAAAESVAVVESVKAASEVFAPLAGRITEVNAALAEDPTLANHAPEADGWFFRLVPADPAAFALLLDQDAYQALLAEQA